jgi:hypothetical protein
MFSNFYPYTDFHELNLDWIISEVKRLANKIDMKYDEVLKIFIMQKFNDLFAGMVYDDVDTLDFYIGVVGDGEHIFTPDDETMHII